MLIFLAVIPFFTKTGVSIVKVLEDSEAITRAEVGSLARMRQTLDALRSLPQGGTSNDVHREMVDRGIGKFHRRTTYRHLHALRILGLASNEVSTFNIGECYWWRPAYPTRHQTDF